MSSLKRKKRRMNYGDQMPLLQEIYDALKKEYGQRKRLKAALKEKEDRVIRPGLKWPKK